jgi:hypothetical protein
LRDVKRELESIAAEIEGINGDVNGVYEAVEFLLREKEYFRFASVRLSEKCGECRGVAEYDGYAVVIQDRSLERIEIGKERHVRKAGGRGGSCRLSA